MNFLSILEKTKKDLEQDSSLYEYLLEDRLGLLHSRNNYLQIYHPTQYTLSLEIEQTISNLQKQIRDTKSLLSQISTENHLRDVHTTLYQIFLEIRSLFSVVASIALSSDWQSPSFQGWINQAGIQKGTIKASINDYKRDQHKDALAYELAFRKAYIRHSIITPIRIFATNSGMSSLTTIIGFLIGENFIANRPIVVGKHSYFENKKILQSYFKDMYVEVDENDLSTISTIASEKNPAAWFFDSLCNDHTVTKPNLSEIGTILKKIQSKNTFIVVDNTALSIHFQPFSKPFIHAPNLIVWESLLKHHQFGMDRVNGGIIYAHCARAEEMYTYRDHLGTNITDYQVLSIPHPSNTFLLDRLQRHARNHKEMVIGLTMHIHNNPTCIVREVVSPLQHSNSLQNLVYPGAFFCINFSPRYETVTFYKKFLHNLLRTAEVMKIPLIGGTSFGLPITRVYIPASRPNQGVPFIRVSVGMESQYMVEKLITLFKEVISSY